MRDPFRFDLSTILIVVFLSISGSLRAQENPPREKAPEINVGERLFLDTRFAQFFARHAGDPNQDLASGDPVMDTSASVSGGLPGPFKGKSMNCRACHLVDEHVKTPGGTMRTYADFARRSPIPAREDGRTLTLRNSPAQVNASIAREFFCLHLDGEFTSMEDLVKGTLVGRNFGWMPTEESQAVAHIARIIRADDGKFPLSADSGGAYRKIFKGGDDDIPPKYRLPAEYRLDIASASDADILNAIAKLIAAYVIDLKFHQDDKGYDTSPYDVFLRKNHLPIAPDNGETPLLYARRLSQQLSKQVKFTWANKEDGAFKSHKQDFTFGETELRGLRIFLSEPSTGANQESLVSQGGVGNCIACHQPPHFTDFSFHNTGISQEEYDAVQGPGEFAKISIPGYEERQKNFAFYLPTCPQHATAAGETPFADIPAKDSPGHADLGMWNVFLNPNFPKPQNALLGALRRQYGSSCDPKELLPLTIAAFKTPGLRDLGHSAPYFHTGRFDDLAAAVAYYRKFSREARAGKVRNADRELLRIFLTADDVPAVEAFLRSLNEDYE
jgi:cytochrome c peroxidase